MLIINYSFNPLGEEGNITSEKLFDLEQPHTRGGGLTDNIAVFFGSPVVTLSSADRLYLYEEAGHFLIKIFDPKGAYQRAFYYPHPTVPLTRESASEGGITGTHFRHEFLFEHMDSMDLPEKWPVLNDMKIDDQDRLWVATTVEDMSVHQWWVLDKNGKLIARFTWPRDKPIQEIRNGYLYTKETLEETGVEEIVRYRIEIQSK